MIKYSDMEEVQSIKTGEKKVIPATEAKKLKKPDGVKTGESVEWRATNEENSGVRTDGSERQEEV
jgi:hypothetical protein